MKYILNRYCLIGPIFLFVALAFTCIITLSAQVACFAAEETPGSFSQLVKRASPSVVYISTVKVIKAKRPFHHPFGNSNPNDPFDDFFDQFFGRQGRSRDFRQKSLGSGFIIDKDGFILTNNHVVEKSDEIKVMLANEKEFSAEIIGRDPKTDLALIRIKTSEPLEPVIMGDSDSLNVGDWVVAIGNPFGLGNTVTAGIVSYKSRNIGAGPYDDFIQTDAAINPGNSGGPLLNTAGEVIGINTAIFSQTGGSVGIGFAIPINMAKDLIPQLKEGKVVRGWMGVMIQKITPEIKEKLGLKHEKGALVADVTPDSPASKAGIKRGDVIVSFDGKDIVEMKDLPFLVGATPVKKDVVVEVIRDGEKKSFKMTVEELKDVTEQAEAKEPQIELGMTVEELNTQLARKLGVSQTSGLVVLDVERDSAAAEAGITRGDIIVEVDQVEVKDISKFHSMIRDFKKGETILFLVKRADSTVYLTLKVE
ncbi:putative periplasmic serine endoprotease DegP-like [uncultured Desulfobacterium sp.]|uniref:Probable periplasmic serine endoprotease DegP-like n=1 Tax=uncultured Desulfobacterium sp. TaxID=201089 RepID=A0A445MUQ9_9BACT|nr:putative periplasmic serine endoprotease DegP-like [uncultured Desulfobacterium sp.]